MKTPTKSAARALFLSGNSPEAIAERLNLDVEMIEVWRDEGCWGPALDLETAAPRLSPGTKDAEDLERLHEFIADAFGRVLAWITKSQGELDITDARDWSAVSKLSRVTSKALELKQKIDADIGKTRDLRKPPHVGGAPCVSPRRSAGASPRVPSSTESRSVYESDDNAVLARGLAFTIATFAKVLSGERPRDAAALAHLAGLVSEALVSLWRLRKVMKGVEHGRRVDQMKRFHVA